MKIKRCNNSQLVHLLKDRNLTIENLKFTIENLDDSQLKTISNFNKLKEYEKDIMYLTALYPVSVIADLYAVSKTSVYKIIKRIQKKINCK